MHFLPVLPVQLQIELVGCNQHDFNLTVLDYLIKFTPSNRGGFFMIRYFIIFLYMAIPYLPLFDEIDRIGSQSLILSSLNVLSIGLIFYQKKQNDFFDLFRKKEIIFYGLFIVSIILSSVKAINLTEFSIEFFRAISYFIALLVFLTLFREEKYRNYIIWLMLFFITLDILALLLQFMQGLPILGFTGNKNIGALSLALKLNFLFYIINKKLSVYVKTILFLLYSLGFYMLININSKAGILIYLLSLIYYLFFSFYFLKQNKTLLYNTLIGIFAISIVSLVSNVQENISVAVKNTIVNYQADAGNTQRIKYYKQVYESFKEDPFFGVGFGNWKIVSIKYDAHEMIDYIVQYFSHNDFLQVLAETGIFGFIAYVMFFFTLFFKIFSKTLSGLDFNKDFILIFIGMAFLTYVFDALLNFPGYRVVSQLNLLLIIVLLNLKTVNEN